MAVNDGRSVITLDHDRAGTGAAVLRFAASCDITGTVETGLPTPGMRHYQRVDRSTSVFRATWYDRFPGGCLTYRLHSTSDLTGSFAAELPGLLGFQQPRHAASGAQPALQRANAAGSQAGMMSGFLDASPGCQDGRT
jgi:hypothetical protein